MLNAHKMNEINANFAAASAFNRSITFVWSNPQKAQLLGRLGDIMAAAAKSERTKAEAEERAEAAIAEWERVNSWENMPCGEEW